MSVQLAITPGHLFATAWLWDWNHEGVTELLCLEWSNSWCVNLGPFVNSKETTEIDVNCCRSCIKQQQQQQHRHNRPKLDVLYDGLSFRCYVFCYPTIPMLLSQQCPPGKKPFLCLHLCHLDTCTNRTKTQYLLTMNFFKTSLIFIFISHITHVSSVAIFSIFLIIFGLY